MTLNIKIRWQHRRHTYWAVPKYNNRQQKSATRTSRPSKELEMDGSVRKDLVFRTPFGTKSLKRKNIIEESKLFRMNSDEI